MHLARGLLNSMRAASLEPMSRYDAAASVYQTKGLPFETMYTYVYVDTQWYVFEGGTTSRRHVHGVGHLG